ncbi:MAG: molybdate ABC transporter substrate-binding protein [Byssovorax sp.]
MWGRSFTAISRLFALFALFALAACSKSKSGEREVVIAAAASLRGVLPDLAARHEAAHVGVKVVATYGASGDLRKQVEGGAPIDGVVFASGKPVDDLIGKGKVIASSRRVLATNVLVLIGPKGGPKLTFATLGDLPADEKLAIGDPGAVPAGQYARDYLEKRGVYARLQGRMVLGGDVGAVLAYARRGEVAAAIVYRTEIRGISDVVELDRAGADAPRIEVVAGVVGEGKAAAEAERFFAFMASPAGQEVFKEFGFGPP